MEITKGVRLHFIQSEKFKTNKIRVRFSAPMSKETVAGRVLTASMLETVNAVYPTSQAFRERLANLYGADYSTSLSRRGLVHYLDINLSFVHVIQHFFRFSQCSFIHIFPDFLIS